MRRTLCAAVLAAAAAGCTARAQDAEVRVTVDPGAKHQTILGWGKSTPQQIVPAMLRELVLERAVDDLGLTRLRLEPPSGNRSTHRNWEWLNDNADPYDINWDAFSTEALDERVAGWLVPFKQRVEANGDRFDLYVSPSFFNSGSSGMVPPWLLRDPAEYVEWATAILLRLRDRHDVVADYYCICNEAGNNNLFQAPVVGQMIKALGPRLAELGLPTRIEFPECVNADTSWRYIQALQDDAEVWRHVGLVAYHLYGGNAARPQIRDFALARGLPTGQTEFMGVTIEHLYDDLTEGGVSYWEIYGLGGPAYGQLKGHVDSTAFNGGPHYWDFRQVMHYVRPGAVRVEASSADEALRSLAFARDGGVTVVLINNGRPLADRAVTVTGLPAGRYGVCQSLARRPYEERGVQTVAAGGALTLDVRRISVVTIYPHPGGNLAPTVTEWRSQPNFLTIPRSRTTLSASATDPELDALSYAWSVVRQPAGVEVSLATPREARTEAEGLTAAGEYVFAVTVDDGRQRVSREMMLTVFAGNQPPVPVDVHNRIPVMVTLPDSRTELRGGAWDIESDPLTYRWSIVQQPEGAAAALERPDEQKCRLSNLTVAGDYVIKFEVSDRTHTVPALLTVPVYPENAGP